MSLSPIRKATLISMTLFLTACGGSGGGGGSDDNASGQTVDHLKSLVMDSRSLASKTVSLTATDESADALAGTAEGFSQLLLGAVTYGNLPVEMSVLGSKVTCSGEGGSLSLRKDIATETRVDATVTLTQCELYNNMLGQKVTLSGTIRGIVDGDLSGKTTETISILAQLDLSGSTEQFSDLKLQGDVLTVYIPSAGQYLMQSPRLEQKADDHYIALVDLKSGLKEGSTGDALDFSTTVVSSDLGGRATLKTTESLRFNAFSDCPQSGVMTMTSADEVTVRFGDDTGTPDAIVVEVNDNRVAAFSNCLAFGNFARF